MKIFRRSQDFVKANKPLVLTIGNFDGVHIGHKKTILETIQEAKSIDGLAAAMLFDPHPRSFFNNDDPEKLITPLEQRINLLTEIGLDIIIVEPFDDDFAAITPEDFINTILVDRLAVSSLHISSKFRFGNKASGNLDTLKQAEKEDKFKIRLVDNVYFRNTVVSSSFIRNAILDGEMEIVRMMLDRPYTLKGKVYPDTRRGTNLFNTPTSNIKPENDIVPALGIYASVVELDKIRYPAATYIGTRPTFAGNDIVIEAHLIGFDGDLYGKNINVELLKKTRADQRFEHLSDLLHQIKKDIEDCVSYLKKHQGDAHVGQLKWTDDT